MKKLLMIMMALTCFAVCANAQSDYCNVTDAATEGARVVGKVMKHDKENGIVYVKLYSYGAEKTQRVNVEVMYNNGWGYHERSEKEVSVGPLIPKRIKIHIKPGRQLSSLSLTCMH